MKKISYLLTSLLITLTLSSTALAESALGFVGLGGNGGGGDINGTLEAGFRAFELGEGGLYASVAVESNFKKLGGKVGIQWQNGIATQSIIGIGGYYANDSWGGFASVATAIPLTDTLAFKPAYEYRTDGSSRFGIGLLFSFKAAPVTPTKVEGAEWNF